MLISSSLSGRSRSALLINSAFNHLESLNLNPIIIDLRTFQVPFCDGRDINQYPLSIQELFKNIQDSEAIIFGFPVYCYSISGVLKNFIDIFSKSMHNKKFGVCAAAGSKLSYLAIADLYKIMQFQSYAIGVNPAVVVDSKDFEDDKINTMIEQRIADMISELLK